MSEKYKIASLQKTIGLVVVGIAALVAIIPAVNTILGRKVKPD